MTMAKMLGTLLLASLLGANGQSQFTGLAVEPSSFVGGEQLSSLGVMYWPSAAIGTNGRLALAANYPIFSGAYTSAQPFTVGPCLYTVAPAVSDATHLVFTLSDAVAGTTCNVATTAGTVLPIGAAYLGRNPDGCNTVTMTAVSTNAAGAVTNALTQASYDTLCGSGSSGCWYLFFLFFLIPCCCIPCCLLLLFLRRRRNKPMGCRPVNNCCPQQPQWGASSGLFGASSSFLPSSSYLPSFLPPSYLPTTTTTISAPFPCSAPALSTYTTSAFPSALCAPAPTYTMPSMYTCSSPYYY